MWKIAPKSHSVSQVSSHKFINSQKRRRLYEFENQRVLCECHKTADKCESACFKMIFPKERETANNEII